ncbi:MAG: ADP-dependent NAD(P)H-hydrate dehydratase [Candidatus Nanohaloarchaea archaeon]|jgi:ADP-dependent NAD(P)H-hydrate dehydratase
MRKLLDKLERRSDSHKGENGRVAVIAGSQDFAGAPALSAKAALRSGCDLVKILTSEHVSDTVAGYSENFIVDSHEGGYFGEDAVDKALKLDEWADVTVVGPGLSEVDRVALQEFLELAESELVIDADAIAPAVRKGIKGVYTPHSGELEHIVESYGSEEDFVSDTGSILAVKGEKDIIYTEEDSFEISRGTSAMTVGGTGDVLTGIVSSFISQGLDLVEACKLGVWINDKAGELATEDYGNGMLATDLIEKIPEAIQD